MPGVTQAEHDATRFKFLAVLLEEAGTDPTRVLPGQMVYALTAPYERRGYTTADIQGWMDACDPNSPPAIDPVTCFQAKAKQALAPPLGFGALMLAVAGASFAAAFLLTRRS